MEYPSGLHVPHYERQKMPAAEDALDHNHTTAFCGKLTYWQVSTAPNAAISSATVLALAYAMTYRL